MFDWLTETAKQSDRSMSRNVARILRIVAFGSDNEVEALEIANLINRD